MRIEISAPARIDLRQIWLYVAEDNSKAATRLLGRIEARFKMCSRQPLIGEPCFDLGDGMRRHSFGNYVVYYRPTDDAVHILRVLHGARDIQQIQFPESESERS